MCNTTSELGVEHPRGPHRVQHVQHLFNTCLSQVLNNRKRDFSPPRAHWLRAVSLSYPLSKHPWFISVPLGYSIRPLCGRSTSAPVYEPNVAC